MIISVLDSDLHPGTDSYVLGPPGSHPDPLVTSKDPDADPDPNPSLFP